MTNKEGLKKHGIEALEASVNMSPNPMGAISFVLGISEYDGGEIAVESSGSMVIVPALRDKLEPILKEAITQCGNILNEAVSRAEGFDKSTQIATKKASTTVSGEIKGEELEKEIQTLRDTARENEKEFFPDDLPIH